MLVPKLIAAGGLLFAFGHATVAGKLVLLSAGDRFDL